MLDGCFLIIENLSFKVIAVVVFMFICRLVIDSDVSLLDDVTKRNQYNQTRLYYDINS